MSASPDSSPGKAAPGPRAGRIYVVSDAGKRLSIKSVAINKESAKAVHLAESIICPASYQAKRLLIKNFDLIARTEKEALEFYIAAYRTRLIELRDGLIDIERRIDEAEKMLEQEEGRKPL